MRPPHSVLQEYGTEFDRYVSTIGTVRHVRGNLATVVVTVLVLALLGVVAGYVWSVLAPATRYVIFEGTRQPVDPETQSLIEADGWFAVVTGAFGLASGIVGYVLSRRHPPVEMLVGLAAGGLLAGYVALMAGTSAKGTVQAAGPGGFTTTTSLGVTAYGVLFAWPLLSTAVFWVVEFAVSYRQREG
ncbi:hypothetical protein GCM10023074_05410 [Microbispora amethystogenes]|uniref:DUF2567 domain-containing protein n=1 Tax=Microbispora amethystogenes TaxID=1427754 RepID=A0ABQ4F626_9ACTN|nr:hypothetical protein Mam01_04280 [Microbispora amethystogenes]